MKTFNRFIKDILAMNTNERYQLSYSIVDDKSFQVCVSCLDIPIKVIQFNRNEQKEFVEFVEKVNKGEI